MKKRPLFVAFATQKGGAGKTTLTVLVSSYLHFARGYNVAVIDCDFPQHGIYQMRERDTALVMEDGHYKRMAHKQFTALDRSAWPVIESSPSRAVDDAEKFLEETGEHFDIVFFDLPGTVNSPGVLRSIANMDYIFCPVSADRMVLEITVAFASSVNDNIITQGRGRLKELYMVWNLVDMREKTDLYDIYGQAIAGMGLQVMKTSLPDSKRFRHESGPSHRAVFRSTLFPADRRLAVSSGLDSLAEELCSIIKLSPYGT